MCDMMTLNEIYHRSTIILARSWISNCPEVTLCDVNVGSCGGIGFAIVLEVTLRISSLSKPEPTTEVASNRYA